MKSRIVLLGLVLALCLTLSVGCSSGFAASPEAVKIGVLMPLSGANSTSGNYQLEGMQMAVDYVNSHGGIDSMGGATIQLVTTDTAGDIQTALTEIQRLINVEKVSAIVGPFNSTVGASTAPIAIQYKVPYVITNAIADNIMQTGANKYVYRSNYGGSDMVPFRSQVAKYLASKMPDGKLKSVGIVYVNDDWGKTESSIWGDILKEMGVAVALNEGIANNSSDLSSVVNKIKSADPDFVVCAIFLNDAVLLTKQMKQYNCTVQLVGNGTGFSDNQYIPSVGVENVEGVMATRDFSPLFGVRNDGAKAVYEQYLSTHNNQQMPLETTNGWCGMGTMIEAIKAAASTDREKIADALYVMNLDENSFPLWFSIFSGVKFNTAGDAIGRFNQNEGMGETAGQILTQIQNGQYQLVFPEARATAKVNFPSAK